MKQYFFLLLLQTEGCGDIFSEDISGDEQNAGIGIYKRGIF